MPTSAKIVQITFLAVLALHIFDLVELEHVPVNASGGNMSNNMRTFD